jgi:hypothetical protein
MQIDRVPARWRFNAGEKSVSIVASCAESQPPGNEASPQFVGARHTPRDDHQPGYHDAAMGTEAVRFLVLWLAGWIHSR